MLVTVLLALAQQTTAAPAAQAQPSPIARVEVAPATGEIKVGGSLQLTARAVDSAGRDVPRARIRWYAAGDGGSVDSTGTVRGGYRGTVRATAVASVDSGRPTVGQAVIKILPLDASRVEISPAPARLALGTTLTVSGAGFSQHNDRTDDRVTFTSSNPGIVTITPDGRLTAVAPGSATITARAGSATARHPVQVVAGAVSRVTITPASRAARTGDVIRFAAQATGAAGRPLGDVAVRWSVAATGSEGVAQIDDQGVFVAERPGKYTVTARVGRQTADAVVNVELRRVGRGMEVLGRVPLKFAGAEVWVHPGGRCAYMSTIADRVYAIDVSNVRQPQIVDSMMTNSRIVNDIMTTEDGKFGVFSREGASDRKNGIVVFDASDPCHPKPVGEYTQTVSGGVHSSFVYQGHVYLTDDATGSMRVIDIRDPKNPREVGRWQTEQTEAGRYVHDVDVKDGLAYLSYWNDGLIILDVGKGIKGGTPAQPKLVSQLKYNLDETYARVDQLYGLGARGTHTAWRHGKYVFIGDEVYASKPATGLQNGNSLTWGRLQVVDVSDLEKPKIVAWYEPTDGGVHNVWVEGDTLYMGNYQGGARTVDISGELKGDLLRQGREISWIFTADDKGVNPHQTFAWGAVVKNGTIYVPDINSGLWILRMEPRREPVTP